MDEKKAQENLLISKYNTLESNTESELEVKNFWTNTEGREQSKIRRKIVTVLVFVIVIVIVLLPFFGISIYYSFTTCDGIFGDYYALNLKSHRNYAKFDVKYEETYDLAKVNESPDFEKYPWIIRIIGQNYNETSFLCTAFLISDRYALTAAHCVVFDDDWKLKELYLGGTAENNFNDTLIIPADELITLVHPEYNKTTDLNDLALIRFKNPITTSKTVHPLRLPFDHPNIPETLNLTGWISENTMKNPQLKEEVIPVIPEEECKKYCPKTFQNKTHKSGIISSTSPPKRFCAGREETTINKGDSGSPLVLMDINGPIAFGVTSLGKKDELKNTDKLIPGLFTNIYPYLHWILCKAEDDFNHKGCGGN